MKNNINNTKIFITPLIVTGKKQEKFIPFTDEEEEPDTYYTYYTVIRLQKGSIIKPIIIRLVADNPNCKTKNDLCYFYEENKPYNSNKTEIDKIEKILSENPKTYLEIIKIKYRDKEKIKLQISSKSENDEIIGHLIPIKQDKPILLSLMDAIIKASTIKN